MSALELKVPPLALVLIFAGAMWGSAVLFPNFAFILPWRLASSIALAGLGSGFALAGVAAFRWARTTVNPTRPDATSAMVSSGVYRVSRNPMYVGFVLALVALAVFLAHAFAFILLPVFVAYMNRFQIGPEESTLREKFGEEYQAYVRAVPRWLL